MNNPVKRCQDWRTSLHENIEPNMYCAPFRTIVPCQFILVTRINRACFVISTNANSAALSLHPLEEMARKCLNIGQLYQITQFSASNAQIEDDIFHNTHVWLNHGSHLIGVAFQ